MYHVPPHATKRERMGFPSMKRIMMRRKEKRKRSMMRKKRKSKSKRSHLPLHQSVDETKYMHSKKK